MVQVTRIRSVLAGTAALAAAVFAYVIVGPMAGVSWSLHHGSGYNEVRLLGVAGFPLVATILCEVLYETLDRSNLFVAWRRDLGGHFLSCLGEERYVQLQKTRPDEMRPWELEPYRRSRNPARARPRRIVPTNCGTYDNERRRHLSLVEREILPKLLGSSGAWISESYWHHRRAYDLVGIIRDALFVGSAVGVAYAAIRAAGQQRFALTGFAEGAALVTLCDAFLILIARSFRRGRWEAMRDLGNDLKRHYEANPADFLAIIPLSAMPGSPRRIEGIKNHGGSAIETPETATAEEDAAIFDQAAAVAPDGELPDGPSTAATAGGDAA